MATRKFKGETFRSFATYKKKSSAEEDAKSLKKRVPGYKARIVKKKKGYELYTRS